MFGASQVGSYAQAAASAASYLPSPSSLAIIILVAILSYFIATTFFYGRYTVPLPSYKSGFRTQEGFKTQEAFTIPKRSMLPPPTNCLSENMSAASMLTVFSSHKSTTEEGERDLVEMKHLLNKLSCFQKDLVSPKYTINATLKQPFITSHDIEPISETTGRCFAKTIPPRDIDIAMDKWTERGGVLLLRLCTSFSIKDAEATQLETTFKSFMREIYDITRDKCLQKEPLDVSKRGPRDPSPFSSKADTTVGDYTGYY